LRRHNQEACHEGRRFWKELMERDGVKEERRKSNILSLYPRERKTSEE
jgi:hypothetical protein